MKAVVMYPDALAPVISERKAPTMGDVHEGQLLIKVKAAAIKNLDISKAMGKHYSSRSLLQPEGQIIGTDGVGVTSEGNKVYGFSKGGVLAEYALIDKSLSVPVPAALDEATAAAIPNAVMGSAMALLFRAGLKAGETVLINGATGVTGRMAIQVAKHYGAGSIIVTGRNQDVWPQLQALGADKWITLTEEGASLTQAIRRQHSETPIDVVLDYLWGPSASAILDGLKGDGDFGHPVRYVSIGGMAGDRIALSSSILRSTPLTLMGSGLGSWSKQEVGKLIQEILPTFFQLAVEQKLRLTTKEYKLEDISAMWNAKLPSGIRAVVRLS